MKIQIPCVTIACLGALLALPALGQQPRADEAPVLPSQAGTSPQQPGVPDHFVVDGHPVGERVESREGEICLACGKPITDQDVTYLVEGQRVPLHLSPCLELFGVNPAQWLAKLKPRGAFLDASAAQLGLSANWLFFGSYILIGLIFGALAAHRAFHVGRDPLTWLGIGLAANLPGYLVLLALPRRKIQALAAVPAGLGKIAMTYSPDACPSCGAENHPSAQQCSACGNKLAPRVVSEVERAGLRTS